VQFIDESVEVEFLQLPMLEKKPDCPQAFIWREQKYEILETLEVWQDFSRKGKMGNNMRPEHITRAARVGSWGVGRFFFRVRVTGDRFFDLYYDRAPEDVFHRKGGWFLMGERKKVEE
jgi:hypothetical protein